MNNIILTSIATERIFIANRIEYHWRVGVRQSRYILAALIFVVGLWGGVSSADNFTFTVGNDNMLVSYIPNNSYSNYSVKYQWGKPGSTIQTLIQFDDIIGSNPGQIPLGRTITNAMLNFFMYTTAPAKSAKCTK